MRRLGWISLENIIIFLEPTDHRFYPFTYLACQAKNLSRSILFSEASDSGKSRQESGKMFLVFYWLLSHVILLGLILPRYGDNLAGKYLNRYELNRADAM